MFKDIVFRNPEFLFGLIIVPLLLVWYFLNRRTNKPILQFSAFYFLKNVPGTFRQKVYPVLFVLRLLTLTFAIIALARPQTKLSSHEVNVEGVDIVVALDISGSMQALDFKPNRLEAAKAVAKEFIEKRKNDRIGLVVFAGEAFTQCPMTIDHAVLLNLLKQIQSGIIDDGTAMGDGLATAINRIKDSKSKSKVIILLTDGVNNAGAVDPLSAAEIAHQYGITLYTIGVGTRGRALFPVKTPFGTQYIEEEVEIDDAVLKKMAAITKGGTYFRATDARTLKSIFHQIDNMEKSKIDVTQYDSTKEEFFIFLLIAVICLGLEILLRQVYFRTMP